MLSQKGYSQVPQGEGGVALKHFTLPSPKGEGCGGEIVFSCAAFLLVKNKYTLFAGFSSLLL